MGGCREGDVGVGVGFRLFIKKGRMFGRTEAELEHWDLMGT